MLERGDALVVLTGGGSSPIAELLLCLYLDLE